MAIDRGMESLTWVHTRNQNFALFFLFFPGGEELDPDFWKSCLILGAAREELVLLVSF